MKYHRRQVPLCSNEPKEENKTQTCPGSGQTTQSVEPTGKEMDAMLETFRQHRDIQRSNEGQADTINGAGLPTGPCQCRTCRIVRSALDAEGIRIEDILALDAAEKPSFQQNQQPEGGGRLSWNYCESCHVIFPGAKGSMICAQCAAKSSPSPSADLVPSSIGTTPFSLPMRIDVEAPWEILNKDGKLDIQCEHEAQAQYLVALLNSQASSLSADLRALLSHHSPLSPDDRASLNEFYLSQCGTEGVRDKEILDWLEKAEGHTFFSWFNGKGKNTTSQFEIREYEVIDQAAHESEKDIDYPDLRSAVIAAITAEGKAQ